MNDLDGKVAVVTGAAGGMGLAMATAFATAGMRVVLADLDEPVLHDEVERLRSAGATVAGERVDVRDADDVEALAAKVVERFGALHVAVNNAGIVRRGPAWEVSLDDWRAVLDVNLWGVIHGIRSFVPRILATGEPGHVVNTGSMASVQILATLAPYTATKHAVLGISDVLRADLAAIGAPVGVTVLMPGLVHTRMVPTGMDPAIVAGLVLDAVRAGEPYVFNERERRVPVEERFTEILAAFDRI